jgi:hypothetical protein
MEGYHKKAQGALKCGRNVTPWSLGLAGVIGTDFELLAGNDGADLILPPWRP